MRERDRAHKAKCDNPESEVLKEEFRKVRNQVKSAQNKARIDYFLSSYQQRRHTTWKDIGKFLILPKGGDNVAAANEPSTQWADKLNEHFATVGSRVAAALEEARRDTEPLPPRPPVVVSGAFRVRPATLPELSYAIKRMSTSRSSGEDGITIDMLRMTFAVIGPHLLDVINSSLISGQLPTEWKLATVVPLHKSGSLTEPTNYRPVSIISTVAKITESVVCVQLVSYLESHAILSDVQHGFRPGRSTETAMLDAIGWLMDGMDQGCLGSVTTADTSKAFDSVEHSRLIEKLGWYGIDSHWFQGWLSERTQKVKGGEKMLPLTHGVVQGSLLGPILFLLFTNDLMSHVDSKIVMYADDAQFLHRGLRQNTLELQGKVEATFKQAHTWFTHNSLKINPTKTDLMIVRPRQRRSPLQFSVRFGDTDVKPSPTAKILGVVVDDGLNFDAHVTTVVKRCYATLGGLAKFSYRLPEQVKKMIVETLIFPHLSYCLSAWSGCNKLQRNRIQKVINHCARVVKGARKYDHLTPLLRDLNWPQFEQIIQEHDLTTMHYVLCSKNAPLSLRSSFIYRGEVSRRETRASDAGDLHLPRMHTEHGRRFFSYRATSLWNLAPAEVKATVRSASCRKRARLWLEGIQQQP